LVNVRLAIRDGKVIEFSATCSEHQRADARLERVEGSPDPDVEGKVKIDTRGDDEEFEAEAENLAPGTIVEVFLSNPDTDQGFVSIGTAAANADGEAELERDTGDGDRLPLGVRRVDELSGFKVEIRLASTGETLLAGEVPSLPEMSIDLDEIPTLGENARGRALLDALEPGLEGHVEIRRRPEQEEQRFEMEAEGLRPGTGVLFQIEHIEIPGTFVTIADGRANEEGEVEISTQDGLRMPFNVRDVENLVGLTVRVLSAETEEVLLIGEVPALVAD
ncbi:MAG: hypothetical protein OER88_06780, partial [Planctomycetota bacterium]|nr:hypothetical protein [Planctomycetota bacterium]